MHAALNRISSTDSISGQTTLRFCGWICAAQIQNSHWPLKKNDPVFADPPWVPQPIRLMNCSQQGRLAPLHAGLPQPEKMLLLRVALAQSYLVSICRILLRFAVPLAQATTAALPTPMATRRRISGSSLM